MPLPRFLGLTISTVLAGLMAACGSPDPSSRSGGDGAVVQDGRFQNRQPGFEPKALSELLRWRWQALRDGLPTPPREPIPIEAPDTAFLQANARAGAAMVPAVTWIGHATVLVQAGGLNVLTDPIFSERASPLTWIGPKRAQPPALDAGALPRIDVVVISHNHYDHLDEASVKALAAQPGGSPLFIVPLGLKAWLADHGIANAVELDWWQVHRVGDTEVMLTPVQHWSARGLGDRMKTLWGGYAVLQPGFRWFFAGDTGYSQDFREIARRLAPRLGGAGFDLALLPIGAYEPRWFMQPQHVNPAEAVQIHRDLSARRSLGIHWGTFALTDESLDEPPRALASAREAAGLAEDAFFVMPIGRTQRLDGRPAP
jgi:N-acyl-phosphatidylethanolamine-hydrolysing phospholipase D